MTYLHSRQTSAVFDDRGTKPDKQTGNEKQNTEAKKSPSSIAGHPAEGHGVHDTARTYNTKKQAECRSQRQLALSWHIIGLVSGGRLCSHFPSPCYFAQRAA